jgi:hypothetical protein
MDYLSDIASEKQRCNGNDQCEDGFTEAIDKLATALLQQGLRREQRVHLEDQNDEHFHCLTKN